jgi:hypothetical protein
MQPALHSRLCPSTKRFEIAVEPEGTTMLTESGLRLDMH